MAYADLEVPEGGSFDDMVALIGDKNIGEGLDKVIAKLAEANGLRGVIDNAHFNDEAKLGKGQEMVDKLSKLINIFRRPELNFENNRIEGDDIIGDAYEYLMRNFAAESGKSKGQFYTPAEVSRVLAKVLGISNETSTDATICDPACGSGSLLIRALDEAPLLLSGYGQEKEGTTAGLAIMNTVLHNKATTTIKSGNTFSDPQYFEEGSDDTVLRRFDYIVANPPFSTKNWTDGIKEFGRFDGYGDRPPEKNGDFAWLLHILKSLKNTGKAAVILPHGVLFRGNAEATIRKSIIDQGFIKGIIGLPANLFYGTGIPACIIIIDKENADTRTGIFMIDASHDYVKDGNKNRLRERDIYKIVTTFNEQILEEPKYARFVLMTEIKEKNEYNLNIPRYIDSGEPEDLQSIEAHLTGGIPVADVDSMASYWTVFSKLKKELFSDLRDGYYQLNIDKTEVRNAVYSDTEFTDYANLIDNAFLTWQEQVDTLLRNINETITPKDLISLLSEKILAQFEPIELVDKYDVYQVLLAYWQDIMADDVYVLLQDGYDAARELNYEYVIKKKKEGDTTVEVQTDKVKSWDGKLIPKTLIIDAFFAVEKKAIDAAEVIVADTQAQIDEMLENAEDTSALLPLQGDNGKITAKALKTAIDEIRSKIVTDEITDLLTLQQMLPLKKKDLETYVEKHPLCEIARNDKGNINATGIKSRIASIRETELVPERYADDYEELIAFYKLMAENDEKSKLLKDLYAILDESVKEQYALLTDDEIKEQLVNKKWYYSIYEGIDGLYTAISHNMANRITELAERYEQTLTVLEKEVAVCEAKVKAHLERMGFVW